MTIKSITKPEEPIFDGIPLVGEYLKALPKEVGSIHEVTSAKVSSSGQWLMVDCEKFRVMFSMKGTQGITLISLFSELNACLADKMVAVCEKTKKGYGAYIASDDSEKREYFWSDNVLEILPEGTGNNKAKKQELNAKAFNATKLK